MTPQRDVDNIVIYEWPQPVAEIYNKDSDSGVVVRTPDEARAILESMQKFLESIGENV